MKEPTLDTLTQRLDRLERQNRRLKVASGAVLFGIAAILLMGQGSSPIVEAERFLVRDPTTGKFRGALSVLQDGSVGLSISAPDGKSLSLSANASGNVGLTLYDKQGKLRAELVTGVDGAPALALRDQGGKVIWKAP